VLITGKVHINPVSKFCISLKYVGIWFLRIGASGNWGFLDFFFFSFFFFCEMGFYDLVVYVNSRFLQIGGSCELKFL
jgi:hypothetical protein